MKTIDSAVQWIEVNIEQIVKECGGDIGPTSRHRYAQHIFSGIAHMYSDMVEEEHKRYCADMNRKENKMKLSELEERARQEREEAAALAAERGSKYLDLLNDHPILLPILDILAAFLEEREQFAEDLERAEEFGAGVEAHYQKKLEQAQHEADRLESERSQLQSDLYDARDELDAERRKHGRGW